MLFPFDFGFIPATIGDDGDPLDVLLLLDEPAPMGCVIRIRAIGVIEARQREGKGKWIRNDRLIAVAIHAKLHSDVESLKEIGPRIVDEIEAFFRDYNQQEDREFQALKRSGPKTAMRLIDEGRRRRGAA
jgi:inorganic pyrophosphatase